MANMQDQEYGAVDRVEAEVPAEVHDVETKRTRGWVLWVGLLISATAAVAAVQSSKHAVTPVALKVEDSDADARIGDNSRWAKFTDFSQTVPSNWQASALYFTLKKVGWNPYFLFGHENSNREGQYFWDNAGMDAHSDVFNTTGQ